MSMLCIKVSKNQTCVKKKKKKRWTLPVLLNAVHNVQIFLLIGAFI